MSTTTDPAGIQLHDAVLAALAAQEHLDVLDGAIGEAGEPGYRLDPDGRAHMTAVLWWGADASQDEDDTLAGDRPLARAAFQVTAVGGDQNRALRAAAKVTAALDTVRLVPWAGRCTPDLDSPRVQRDPAATPPRWYVPLVFHVNLNRQGAATP